ncbi:L-type lectin-domain containing receptor kinase IV.1-like [Iris pallida]|uniref:non-specific serine/threonine protein kinase n=1 Tax=Iris pallida TaxID=29817 RepID=A0AAX6GXE1_IRIPA|nr:L-type lectin-domain containing receptor kinase IV.1-like [Iris pallida]
MSSELTESTFFVFFFFFLFLKLASSPALAFTYHGFSGANLSLDGISSIASDGLLQLTNTTLNMQGHAFHPATFRFKSSVGKPLSFSTTFVFAIVSKNPILNGHGLAFVISPTGNLSTAFPAGFLGLFNPDNLGNQNNHIVAVELDTIQHVEFQDIDDNHVGIDINSLISVSSHTAGYYVRSSGAFKNLSLAAGEAMQVWVDFNGEDMQLNVTLSPVQMPKPDRPLLSSTVNVSSVLLDSMYVGFSSATGSVPTYHCILGWSFAVDGKAEPLDYAKLPRLPQFPLDGTKRGASKKLTILLPLALCSLLLLVIAPIAFVVRRRFKYAELLEDWELEYGPHRFKYKDLFQATKGFKEKELLGVGGFGRVYRGVLSASNTEIAVKRVSHESGQGIKEFIAEILSIGQLRHRNIVQLLGYCRRRGELLLVYDFMPNGSLDKFLYDRTAPNLDWNGRFQIIRGVASGLLYLHEGWEQVVVHRDIKSSNILLDIEMNARLGDFGLAKLYDHGADPQTTHVVGTIGYIAPELGSTGKATTATDVFAYGAFLLEVACGRRPLEAEVPAEQVMLVDWVLDNWKKGEVLATTDRLLGNDYSEAEMEMVLKLGLLCSHPMAAARPSMRQVMQFLNGDTALPELSLVQWSFSNQYRVNSSVTISTEIVSS